MAFGPDEESMNPLCQAWIRGGALRMEGPCFPRGGYSRETVTDRGIGVAGCRCHRLPTNGPRSDRQKPSIDGECGCACPGALGEALARPDAPHRQTPGRVGRWVPTPVDQPTLALWRCGSRTVNRRRSKRLSLPQATDDEAVPVSLVHPSGLVQQSSWSQQSHHIADEHGLSPATVADAVSPCSKLLPFELEVVLETGAARIARGSARPPRDAKVGDARTEAWCTQRWSRGRILNLNSFFAFFFDGNTKTALARRCTSESSMAQAHLHGRGRLFGVVRPALGARAIDVLSINGYCCKT